MYRYFRCKYSYLSYYFFSGFLYYSIISISIGNFPQIKKLNNGKYIVISSTGITVLDSTLSIESKTINFDHPIFTEDSSIFSTIINQFSNDNGEYIIALFKNNLYIFSSDGTLSAKKENISFINLEKMYSLIPYGHYGNVFYFSIIYINENESFDLCFIRGIYNSYLKEISFSEEIISGIITSIDSSYLSCILMKYN